MKVKKRKTNKEMCKINQKKAHFTLFAIQSKFGPADAFYHQQKELPQPIRSGIL